MSTAKYSNAQIWFHLPLPISIVFFVVVFIYVLLNNPSKWPLLWIHVHVHCQICERGYEVMIAILSCIWCFPLNSILGSKHGFIYNLSPLKRSCGKGVHWFDFHLQTSPTKVQRVLAFNAPARQQIQHFQNTKTPVFLKNFTIKQDESDWIFNQQSNASVAPNSDITFN